MTDKTNADGDAEDETGRNDGVADPLDDAENVVAAFGGIRPMAKRLGVAATTIQGWKSRGNIPDNRRDAVLAAAQADGIDLDSFVAPDREAEPDSADAPEASSAEAEPPVSEVEQPVAPVPNPPRQGNGLAWLALCLVILVGVALATQPRWTHLIYGAPETALPDDLLDRITALERRPKAPDLSGRVAAAEQALAELRAREPAAAAPDVSPQLRAMAARVDELARALEAARSEGRASAAGRTEDLQALQAAVDALSKKVENAVVDTAQASTRRSSVMVAVGALEVALADGLPYTAALDALRRLVAADEPVFADAIKVLAPSARDGIPTRGQLATRLDALLEARTRPLWKAETDSWTDRVLREIDAVVSVRRIDESAGPADKMRRARKAMSRNDLPSAAEQLGGVPGPAGDWAQDVSRRVAADQAFGKLRLWALETLDSEASGKLSSQ